MDVSGFTLYHDAAMFNRHIILDYLLRVDNTHLNATNRLLETPLHYASWNGYIDCVRVLLSHGANIEIKNQLGKTPLDVVCRDADEPYDKNKDEIIKMLNKYKKK